MTQIELIFPPEFDEEAVRQQFSRADSGFAIDEDQTLRSALVDGFTIGGVVVSTLSLVTALFSLKAQHAQNAKSESKSEPEIRVRRSFQSTSQVLPSGSVQTAVQFLEEIVRSKR